MKCQESVFEFLKESILDLKDLDAANIKKESEIQSLGLDSLDFVEVQVLMKRRFGAQVSPGAFVDGSIRTLWDFSVYVASQAVSV